MIRLLAALILCFLTTAAVVAQVVPFDMRPGATDEAAPPASPAPSLPQPPAVQRPVAPPQPAQPAAPTFRRFLVPASELILAGEQDRRRWSMSLTPEQAASPAVVQIAYQNAIVVAPEISTFSVVVNDVVVMKHQVNSSDNVREVRVEVPAGLLRPGSNVVSFESELRHRTDCTIESTYELWVDIDPARTFLEFANADVGNLRRIDDVASVGVDANGSTQFLIVAPAANVPANATSLLRLAEGLALLSNMPNQSFTITSSVPEQDNSAGRLVVFVGTPQEISPLVDALPASASTAPVTAFTNQPSLGTSALMVSALAWRDIGTLVETLIAPNDRPVTTPRTVIETAPWRYPDPPLFLDSGSATLSQLGIQTHEFAGRRLRTDFSIGIPSDFYAEAYGEATLFLDAAYSPDVRPGSHIDIYVNGNIASNVPVAQSGGGFMNRLPVSLTMRHFRPGPNIISIDSIIYTAEDLACAPGATGQTAPRFALFETSELRMPNFARIARRPNLAAVAGTGFPYGRAVDPVPVILANGDMDTLSAAATLLARMSVGAGRLIPIELAASAEAASDKDAIFVATASNTQPQILSQLGLAEEAQTAWTGEGSPEASEVKQTEVLDRWQRDMASRGWRSRLAAFEDWANERFNILPGSIRLVDREDPPYMPGSDVMLVIAQQDNPAGNGAWTSIIAPKAADLARGMRWMAMQDSWVQIGGRLTAYRSSDNSIEKLEAGSFSFLPTTTQTFGNYRLIAANWLSANVLSYATTLVMLCIILGIVTSVLLSVFGRRQK